MNMITNNNHSTNDDNKNNSSINSSINGSINSNNPINNHPKEYNWFTISLYNHHFNPYSTELFNSFTYSNDSIDKLGQQFTQLANQSINTSINHESIKYNYIQQLMINKKSIMNANNHNLSNTLETNLSTLNTPSLKRAVPIIDKRYNKSINRLNNPIIYHNDNKQSIKTISMNSNHNHYNKNDRLPSNNMIIDTTSMTCITTTTKTTTTRTSNLLNYHHSEPNMIEDRNLFNRSSHSSYSLTSMISRSYSMNSISNDKNNNISHAKNQSQSNNNTNNTNNSNSNNNGNSNKYPSIEHNNNDNPKSNGLGLYCILNTIGLGNFSQVKLATHVLTKERVAIKVLDKSKMNTSTRRLLSQEISILESLHHPNIIRLYEVIETFSHLNLIMEYVAGGDLNRRIIKYGKLNEPESRIVFAQLIAAVNHLHERNIVHRDIKAENILFTYDFKYTTQIYNKPSKLKKGTKIKGNGVKQQKNHPNFIDPNKQTNKIQKLLHNNNHHHQKRSRSSEKNDHSIRTSSSSKYKMKQEEYQSTSYDRKKLGKSNSIEDDEIGESLDLCPDHYRVKLVDFGFSKLIKESNQQLTTFCGSPAYAAPELFESKSYRGGPVDMWALGIVLFFMLTGLLPFSGTTVGQVRRLVLDNCGLQPPDSLSPAAADLYRNLTARQPDLRPTASQLIKYAQFARKDLTPIEIVLRQRSTWTNWLTGQTFPKPLPRFKHCPPLPTTPQIKQSLLDSSSSRYKINKTVSIDKTISNDIIPSSDLIHKQSINTIQNNTDHQPDIQTLNSGNGEGLNGNCSSEQTLLNHLNDNQDDAELEAANYLLSNLGITKDEIQNSYNYVTRSAVTGAYRIMLHKIHRSRRLSQLDQMTLTPYNNNNMKSIKFNSNLSSIQSSIHLEPENNYNPNQNQNPFKSHTIPYSLKQNHSIKLNTNKNLDNEQSSNNNNNGNKSASRLCYLI